MIASLPMYDWPELREATGAWWAGLKRHLQAHGFEAPDRLTRNRARAAIWKRPDLLLSQTCGYPLTHAFESRLDLVATPVYDLDGCSGPDYSSLIVVNAESGIGALEELRGRTAAYNSADSMSGHLALRSVFAPLARHGRFFGRTVRSGNHANSMALVSMAKADVAAIDCVSFAIARRYRPELVEGLRILARGPAAPSLPYVTAPHRPQSELERLRHALSDAAADPALIEVREAVFIAGLEFLPRQAYQRIVQLEEQCAALGYPRLG